jgi:hypothetical protein
MEVYLHTFSWHCAKLNTGTPLHFYLFLKIITLKEGFNRGFYKEGHTRQPQLHSNF